MEPVETKEYKPGPIGKERSLKNRKAKDARGGEGDGLEGGVPGGGVSRATDSSPPTSDTTVPELGGDIECMITVPSAEYNSNSKVCHCHIPSQLGLILWMMNKLFMCQINYFTK